MWLHFEVGNKPFFLLVQASRLSEPRCRRAAFSIGFMYFKFWTRIWHSFLMSPWTSGNTSFRTRLYARFHGLPSCSRRKANRIRKRKRKRRKGLHQPSLLSRFAEDTQPRPEGETEVSTDKSHYREVEQKAIPLKSYCTSFIPIHDDRVDAWSQRITELRVLGRQESAL